MIDATIGFAKVDSPAAGASRDKGSVNGTDAPSPFSATLAAQEPAEPKPDQTAEQSAAAPVDQAANKQDKSKQARNGGADPADADSADDGSEADKAAAAAATLAQMLAGAAPVPVPLVPDLTGESSIPPAADSSPVSKPQLANTAANAAQSAMTAEGASTNGATGAGQGAFAAFASLLEIGKKPETAIAAASTERDALTPVPEAKPSSPTAPGAASLSLFANPLRTTALVTALEAGPSAGLQSAVGSHEWAEELGTRLAVMTAQGDQSGSLRLSPEHLGPLEVQIRMQDDKANVVFGAQHADTRRALEEALPRLREMFAASGLQLGDAGVSREAPRQSQTAWSPRAAGGLSGIEADVSAPVAAAQRRYHLGLLDTVA